MGKVLQDRLAEASLSETAEAAKIVSLVNDSIKMTRELARGLLPVVSEARGLMSALERWSGEVSDLFHVSCHFECPDPVLIYDETQAEHLYHLAQEAVNNAIKHGKARNITIRALAVNGRGERYPFGTTVPGLRLDDSRSAPAGSRFADHELPGAIHWRLSWTVSSPSRRWERWSSCSVSRCGPAKAEDAKCELRPAQTIAADAASQRSLSWTTIRSSARDWHC